MGKSIAQNSSRWGKGQSGNPNGRPAKQRALTELLRLEGEKPVTIGGEVVLGQEALAKAVWQLALTGEVWLMGNRLAASSITEWAHVVKWLYTHVEPPSAIEPEEQPEVEVRIVRVKRPLPEENETAGG